MLDPGAAVLWRGLTSLLCFSLSLRISRLQRQAIVDEYGGLSCTRLVEDSPHKQKQSLARQPLCFFFVSGRCLCSSSLASSVSAKASYSSHKSDVKRDVETGLHDASFADGQRLTCLSAVRNSGPIQRQIPPLPPNCSSPLPPSWPLRLRRRSNIRLNIDPKRSAVDG